MKHRYHQHHFCASKDGSPVISTSFALGHFLRARCRASRPLPAYRAVLDRRLKAPAGINRSETTIAGARPFFADTAATFGRISTLEPRSRSTSARVAAEKNYRLRAGIQTAGSSACSKKTCRFRFDDAPSGLSRCFRFSYNKVHPRFFSPRRISGSETTE